MHSKSYEKEKLEMTLLFTLVFYGSALEAPS